jgi:hypothetical protein
LFPARLGVNRLQLFGQNEWFGIAVLLVCDPSLPPFLSLPMKESKKYALLFLNFMEQCKMLKVKKNQPAAP